MAEKVPGWLERILLPQVNEIKGEVKVLNARIEGLDQKLSARIDGLDQKLTTKIEELDKRLEVTQRLAVVEEQVKELLARN